MDEKDIEYFKVPIYIEKNIKKLIKLKKNMDETRQLIQDYMQTHEIPINTPLELLKYFPEPDVDPNQMKIDLKTGEIKWRDIKN